MTGGPNLMPVLELEGVRLPVVRSASGTSVARSGTSLLPARARDVVVADERADEQARLDARASPRYSPVGSKLSVKPNEFSQPTVSVPPAEPDSWPIAGASRSDDDHRRDGNDRRRDESTYELVVSRYASPSFPRVGRREDRSHRYGLTTIAATG